MRTPNKAPLDFQKSGVKVSKFFNLPNKKNYLIFFYKSEQFL